MLVHYDIPAVDPATWRLEVDGAVRRPLTLDLAALRALPRHSMVTRTAVSYTHLRAHET